jgi:hypothetical protein
VDGDVARAPADAGVPGEGPIRVAPDLLAVRAGAIPSPSAPVAASSGSMAGAVVPGGRASALIGQGSGLVPEPVGLIARHVSPIVRAVGSIA